MPVFNETNAQAAARIQKCRLTFSEQVEKGFSMWSNDPWVQRLGSRVFEYVTTMVQAADDDFWLANARNGDEGRDVVKLMIAWIKTHRAQVEEFMATAQKPI